MTGLRGAGSAEWEGKVVRVEAYEGGKWRVKGEGGKTAKMPGDKLRMVDEQGTGEAMLRWKAALVGDPGHSETQRMMERLLEVYEQHVREAREEGYNARDLPKAAGYRGGEWRTHPSSIARTYYRGGTEEVTTADTARTGEQGEQENSQRRRSFRNI